MKRRALIAGLALSGALLWGLTSWSAIGNGLTRVAQVVGIGAFLGAVLLSIPIRVRVVTIGVLGVLALMPVREVDEARVRGRSIDEARALLGTPYVWGGENGNGIDCSGLVRTSFRRALVREAVTGVNPGLLRRAVELWFFDASALALKDGYRSFAVQVGPVQSLNVADVSTLRPGDFMVTANGLHTMAYAGQGEWIEADPGELRVISVTPPTKNPWFGEPAVLMRWSLFASSR